MNVEGDLEAALGTPSVCKFGVIYEGLSAKAKALVDRRRPDGRYALSPETISAVLAKNGLRVGSTAIRVHRTGRCACQPSRT